MVLDKLGSGLNMKLDCGAVQSCLLDFKAAFDKGTGAVTNFLKKGNFFAKDLEAFVTSVSGFDIDVARIINSEGRTKFGLAAEIKKAVYDEWDKKILKELKKILTVQNANEAFQIGVKEITYYGEEFKGIEEVADMMMSIKASNDLYSLANAGSCSGAVLPTSKPIPPAELTQVCNRAAISEVDLSIPEAEIAEFTTIYAPECPEVQAVSDGIPIEDIIVDVKLENIDFEQKIKAREEMEGGGF